MPHVQHPGVIERPDGRWEVRCPECETSFESVPIGIGVAIADQQIAIQIQANHSARQHSPAGHRVGATT
jgi:hypothetical protein